jgi:putative DNA primase/helicase
MSAIVDEQQRIEAALSFIPPGIEREQWWRVAAALKHELGDGGFDLFDQWSQGDAGYVPADSRDTWRSLRSGGGITIGTLFAVAKEYGFELSQHKADFIDSVELTRRRAERAAAVALEEEKRIKAASHAAALALAVWSKAGPVQADHPYLSRKGVNAVATLREIEVEKLEGVIGYKPESGGERLTGRILIAPVKIGGKLSTIEMIDGDGRKVALYGGLKSGGYWAAGAISESAARILISEGVATGLSAYQCTSDATIAALSCGNLTKAAEAMRVQHPCAEIVILGDIGNGEEKAREAAAAVGGAVAWPDFGPDRPEGATDFNDMHAMFGADAVKRAINSAKVVGESGAHDAGDVDASVWPKPQPLSLAVPPEEYPVESLPPCIRAAVEEVCGFVKAPLPLVASSAIAALSLAIQAHVDVKRAERLTGPTGLYMLTIADSGERKSTCDGFFTKAIRDYEVEQAEAAKPLQKDFQADIGAWEAKYAGIKEKIKQESKAGKSTSSFEADLRDLEHGKPEAPKVPRLIYADATPEALAFSLGKLWPSGGVVSAEAGIVFGSHGMGSDSVMRNLATLNQLWDGNSLTIDRRTTDSYTVRGARLTVALQVQEATIRSFFEKSGALARGTGFLARFLVAWPQSTQGSRPFTEPPQHWPHLATFNQRIAAILREPAAMDDDGCLTPLMLTLSPEAKSAWVDFHDAIEGQLSSGGELYDVRDVASKSADNAGRLAALLHVFSGSTGPISADAFESASSIVAWHLSESRRFFGEIAMPDELAQSARLDRWLVEYCLRERTQMVSKRHAQQYGPVRKSEKLDAAIKELSDLDRLRIDRDRKQIIIKVNPAVLMKGAAK